MYYVGGGDSQSYDISVSWGLGIGEIYISVCKFSSPLLSNQLPNDILMALPGIHTLSGCDSTSCLSGIGKVKMFNSLPGRNIRF